MALLVRSRRPDSGLGNIRSSPSAPRRNIDWVLMTAQMVLAVVGCFVIYSASRTKRADPFLYVTRQVIFLIAAVVAMVVVMAVVVRSSGPMAVRVLAAAVPVVVLGP